MSSASRWVGSTLHREEGTMEAAFSGIGFDQYEASGG
jgi:hypothetical protein